MRAYYYAEILVRTAAGDKTAIAIAGKMGVFETTRLSMNL